MIQHRLAYVVREKSATKKEFATLMGWSQSYLSKLTSPEYGIGLSPIVEILEKFRDINARWLLTGEGYIYGQSLERVLISRTHRLLGMEKYVSVMSEEEFNQYMDIVNGSLSIELFNDETVQRWEAMLNGRGNEVDRETFEALLREMDSDEEKDNVYT